MKYKMDVEFLALMSLYIDDVSKLKTCAVRFCVVLQVLKVQLKKNPLH